LKNIKDDLKAIDALDGDDQSYKQHNVEKLNNKRNKNEYV